MPEPSPDPPTERLGPRPMHPSRTPFAARLRSARLAAGLTLRQAERGAELSRGSLSPWEWGVSFPRVDALVRLAELYQVPAAELVALIAREHDAA